MKKLVFLLVLVVAFAALAAPALAIGPAYVDWSAGSAANAGNGGPHSNYLLTTEKCAVCHSVHAAAVSNAAAGLFGPSATGAEPTQLLLRSSVANACTYCHIDTNVSGLQIYNGVASNYTVDDIYGHNGSTSAECADCHSVHGADTFQGFMTGKILKANNNGVANTSGNVQVEAAATLNSLVTAGGNVFGATAVSAGNVGDVQVTAFCTRCHKTFSDASENTITASGFFDAYNGAITFGNQSYKNHPLKAADAVFSAAGANTTTQVAFAGSETCRSCHAAGNTRVSTSYGGPGGLVSWSFPHWTNDNANFLVAGTSTADANIGAGTIGANTGKPLGSNIVANPSEDGVCLRCHRNGTVGVGINF